MKRDKQKTLTIYSLMSLLLLVATGCGGDRPDDSDPASVKCNAYISVACESLGACYDAPEYEIAQCEADFRQILPCERAQSTSLLYNDCLDAIEDAACGSLEYAFPYECEEVILFPEPVLKCVELLSTTCDWLVRCGAYYDEGTCLTESSEILDCSGAQGLGSTIGTCLSQLQFAGCSDSNLPVSCEGVILF